MSRIAIVTGSSRLDGIGAAICLSLAKSGIDIFFTTWRKYDSEMPWKSDFRDPEKLKQIIEEMNVRCEWMEIDLSIKDAEITLFSTVRETMGEPTILINNASYSKMSSIETITSEDLDHHYALNIRATTLLIKEFLENYNGKQGGRIISLTSGQSLGPMPNELAYAMTKSAIETLTASLVEQSAVKGITINAVNPGPTDTGWITNDHKIDLLNRFPQKRIGQPKDLANLIQFLVSPEAQWITGQVLHSEGGFRR
ncbi:3-oxoacyl-[acyl-carrier protein] reductase [Bacillus pakistanensis]|uniref:3-oxoacyl-[acyl-carrier protein] reductase n=1 Tax=Rossellomorea pakistanensis TaxID=992288 RepID=A0ABS2N8F7_9BACI|nr:SDR family oxidoreductase [Bacillus pakistanensis]MBM7584150.1 3-oxoacyl-[acyl-carrier protein] reductase [Bacillus pakistanensis]